VRKQALERAARQRAALDAQRRLRELREVAVTPLELGEKRRDALLAGGARG